MAKKIFAAKDKVLEKLDTSIRYCNSHRDNVQDLYDQLVDLQVNASTRPMDWQVRAAELKALFPIIISPETQGFIPSIKTVEEELHYDPHIFLEGWLSRWVMKYVGAWQSLPSERIAKPKRKAEKLLPVGRLSWR